MTLPQHMQDWMQDPKGGLAWRSIRKAIQEHDPNCTSLNHAWLPRIGGVTDIVELEDCHDCHLTMRMDGVWVYEKSLHGEVEELSLCKCCFQARVHEDALFMMVKDHVHSTRFFRWQPGTYDLPWWQPGMIGNEENCNRTLGIKTPLGMLFICLNPRLRQKPCKDCNPGE